jgi:hypothetical protein
LRNRHHSFQGMPDGLLDGGNFRLRHAGCSSSFSDTTNTGQGTREITTLVVLPT